MESKKRKSILFFIGEKHRDQKLVIKGKPSFSDALLLTKLSTQPPKKSPYSSIPLGDITKVSINFHEDDLHQPSLEISGDVTEEAIFHLLNHFMIKEGSKTSFLVHSPNEKIRQTKKKKQLISAASKKIES